jgi:hypothetical protein
MGLSLGAVRESIARPAEESLRDLRREQRALLDRLTQVTEGIALLEAVQTVIGIRTEEPTAPASQNGNGRGHAVDERELPTFAAHGCNERDESGPEFELDPRDHWVERASPQR